MKFLVDESLSVRVRDALRSASHDSVHVLDSGLGGATDREVSALAASDGRVVVSADSDFAALLALSGSPAPSLILLRSLDQHRPEEQAAMLVANLGAVLADLEAGAVVSLGARHLRVRHLPI